MSLSTGSAGLDLVFHSVQAGHQHGGKRQIGVGRRVRAAELDPLEPWLLRVDGDPHRGRPVSLAVHQVDRSFVPGHQPPVGVGGRCRKGQHGRGMLEQSTDVPAGHIGQARRSPFRRRRAGCPPSTGSGGCASREPLSWKIGFGMNVTVLPYCQATFLTMYLNSVTSSAVRSRVSNRMSISRLPGGAHFVVMDFDGDARLYRGSAVISERRS